MLGSESKPRIGLGLLDLLETGHAEFVWVKQCSPDPKTCGLASRHIGIWCHSMSAESARYSSKNRGPPWPRSL